jgi:hypothetical protein
MYLDDSLGVWFVFEAHGQAHLDSPLGIYLQDEHHSRFSASIETLGGMKQEECGAYSEVVLRERR